jgi:hypothetical protein
MADITGSIGGEHCVSWSTWPWHRPTAAWESLAICGSAADQLLRPEDDAPRAEATPMQRCPATAEWVAANLKPWTIRDDVDACPG